MDKPVKSELDRTTRASRGRAKAHAAPTVCYTRWVGGGSCKTGQGEDEEEERTGGPDHGEEEMEVQQTPAGG